MYLVPSFPGGCLFTMLWFSSLFSLDIPGLAGDREGIRGSCGGFYIGIDLPTGLRLYSDLGESLRLPVRQVLP